MSTMQGIITLMLDESTTNFPEKSSVSKITGYLDLQSGSTETKEVQRAVKGLLKAKIL
eukprot:gene20943-7807_t